MMAAPESLLELSHNFSADLKAPWLEDDEIVPMDIYTACSIGQYDLVQSFIKSNSASINDLNTGGWTPLMYAAYVGHDSVVNLLLECGTIVVDTRTSIRQSTALMLAASCGNEPVVYFLIQNRADINAMDVHGDTALFYAAHQGHQNVVKMLIDNGADMEKSENKHGLTPLLDTAKEGHEGIFNLLLHSGANPKAKTIHGEDARQIALRYGHMPIVNLIDMQSHKHSHQTLLRSEPGLGNDLMLYPDIAGSPDTKVNNWLGQYKVSKSPKIQDGPELFAVLKKQQTVFHPKREMPNSSPVSSHQGMTLNPKRETPNSSPVSSHQGMTHPRTIPSPAQVGTHLGSFEDYFFANSGGTVKSRSLGRRFEELALNGDGTQRDGSRSSTPEFPLVSSFLQDLKLAKYIPIFEEQEIDFETLLTLTDADLKEIGVTLFGPRRKIVVGIGNWKDQNPPRAISMRLEVEINELRMSLQTALLQLQQAQAQYMQERELRTVYEGYLVEEQTRFQKIHNDVKMKLTQAQSALGSIIKTSQEKESRSTMVQELQSLQETIQSLLDRFSSAEFKSKSETKSSVGPSANATHA
ncbi:ankyrin repeat and SAM domain-containing protein 3 [Nematostella vectensis]|uniref:ankyrin repeat and SAM domain-containing protein 3 n=1 Tax=Nematostella vectensis TaxID=45351 RepID=UPI002076E699|nr:ankyrin repeat and SAM domain-containing protein 3 [Nematostella vectensis]